MSEWREIVLGDHCDRVTVGHVGKMADEYVEEGIPFLRSQNVKPFAIKEDGLLKVSTDFHRKLSKSALHSGDVVVVRTGYPGTAAVIPAHLDGSNCADLVVITPGPDINPHVLAAVFNSAWGKSTVSGHLVGSAQQHFNVGSAKSLRIRLPRRRTQDRIADVLCSVTGLVENNQRRIELLEQMTRAIYREWFVHFRYPGHEDVPHVDSPLGSIPDDWYVAPVKRLVELVKVTVAASEVPADTPAVGLEHIPRRQLSLDSWGRAADLGSRKSVFAPYDLLFGKIRPYFHKVSIAPFDGICSTDALVLRPTAPHWGLATMVVSSDDFVAFATQTANGTKMPRADFKVIGKHLVVVPPDELSRQFTHHTRTLTDCAMELVRRNHNAEILRDVLVPRLVSGQVDVSELDLDDALARVG